MSRILYLGLLIFITEKSIAQTLLKNYVADNASVINTVDPETSVDQDLEAIGKAIGDAKVVMLGEQDHGDAPAFLAKTRLIKYLQEKKGFNVLAFESDFFGLNYGWDRTFKNSLARGWLLQQHIYPIWAFCDAMYPLLYQYIPGSFKTKSPLIVTGFDNQMNASSRFLVSKLDRVLNRLDLPVVKSRNYQSLILPAIDSLLKLTTTNHLAPTLFERWNNYLQQLRTETLSKLDKQDF